uniref:Uncharacterized protein n=1 Tax=Meloidogyne floridensis TaxID=298350 RepID=A0A915NQJ8_9BILA
SVEGGEENELTGNVLAEEQIDEILNNNSAVDENEINMDEEEILNTDFAEEQILEDEENLNNNLVEDEDENGMVEEEEILKNNNLDDDENENNLILEEENELNQKIFVDEKQISDVLNGILNDVNQAEKRILEKENELNQIILVDEHIEDENIYISTLTSPIITTCENINETSSPYKQDNQQNPLAEEQIGEFKKLVDYSFSSASSTFAPFPTPSLTIGTIKKFFCL